MPDDCPFCRILPEQLITSTTWWAAIPDASPRAKEHVLLIPREHVREYDQLPIPAALSFGIILGAVIRDRKLGGRYRIQINGPAYQHIPHLHIHLLSP